MGAFLSRLVKRWISGREVRFFMLGLDAAGKTTILYRLALNEHVATIPSIGFNIETVEFKRFKMNIWDIGGHERIRSLWKHYYNNSQGIIYVIDSNDTERVEEARDELHSILGEDVLKDSILLVIANKQDLPNAIKPQELCNRLRLNTITNRKWQIIGACATTGDGLFEGLNWLSMQMEI